jgi:cytochrome d ubiquinol oxidase subunit II
LIPVIWFCLVAILIAGYVILDGFDLGAGVMHLFVARSQRERGQILRSIGPFWDGNEVWLLAGGGTLYFAFPALYAAAFSGFYLALMIVLWLLILRGIAIEFRNHVESTMWRTFWDAVFGGSSALLALLLGVAVGNVVRGVSLDSSGYFFLPLWTDFRPGKEPGIVDWYSVSIGTASLIALSVHAASWIILKTTGDLHVRSRQFLRAMWWIQAAVTVLITAVSFQIQPILADQFRAQPWGFIFPLIALVGLLGIRIFSARASDLAAFLSSCAYLLGMLTSVVFGVFPNVLPSNSDPGLSLTVYNAAAPVHGLKIGLWWWIPGMILAIGYSAFAYKHFAGKVQIEDVGHAQAGTYPPT